MKEQMQRVSLVVSGYSLHEAAALLEGRSLHPHVIRLVRVLKALKCDSATQFNVVLEELEYGSEAEQKALDAEDQRIREEVRK